MPQIIKYHQWWCKCKDKSSMCEECERALNLLIRHRFWRQWVRWFPEVLHLRVLCHTTIYIYFLVGNPEQNHSSGKSGDLLLRNSRIFFLLILSDSDTEGKSTHAFLDSKFGMQNKKKASASLNPLQSCASYWTQFSVTFINFLWWFWERKGRYWLYCFFKNDMLLTYSLIGFFSPLSFCCTVKAIKSNFLDLEWVRLKPGSATWDLPKNLYYIAMNDCNICNSIMKFKNKTT